MKAKQNMTLEDIIANGEDSQVEVELDEIHPNQLAGEMVAFANTYGGRILLGIDDEGNIVGVKRENIDEWIANISSNNCQPTILPQISRIRVNGNIVIIIEVQKGVEPHKVSDGRYYIRVGSINREMSTFELARLFQQRQLVFLKRHQ
ncbi:ATP-binding protein [bacterium]|nr:ATP-binding protein [bacterium]